MMSSTYVDMTFENLITHCWFKKKTSLKIIRDRSFIYMKNSVFQLKDLWWRGRHWIQEMQHGFPTAIGNVQD